MKAVDQFKDPTFIVPTPDGMDSADITGVNPNDEERIGFNRDDVWFLDTWRHYLKPKYKIAIKRWDTQTGGGSNEPEKFAAFTNGCTWLVWVYMMDLKADFLLYSNAKGRPPAFVGLEAGFDTVCDDNQPDVSGARWKQKQGKNKMQVLSTLLEERGNKIDNLVELVKLRFEGNQNDKPTNGNGSGSGEIIQQICAATKRRRELEDAVTVMSPDSKAVVLKASTDEIVKLGRMMKKVCGEENNAYKSSHDTENGASSSSSED
jgi:hypothetical protein